MIPPAKCDEKYLGTDGRKDKQTEGRTEVKQYTPPPPPQMKQGYNNLYIDDDGHFVLDQHA